MDALKRGVARGWSEAIGSTAKQMTRYVASRRFANHGASRPVLRQHEGGIDTFYWRLTEGLTRCSHAARPRVSVAIDMIAASFRSATLGRRPDGACGSNRQRQANGRCARHRGTGFIGQHVVEALADRARRFASWPGRLASCRSCAKGGLGGRSWRCARRRRRRRRRGWLQAGDSSGGRRTGELGRLREPLPGRHAPCGRGVPDLRGRAAAVRQLDRRPLPGHEWCDGHRRHTSGQSTRRAMRLCKGEDPLRAAVARLPSRARPARCDFPPGIVVGAGGPPEHLGVGHWASPTRCISWGASTTRFRSSWPVMWQRRWPERFVQVGPRGSGIQPGR